MEKLSAAQASELLGVTIDKLELLEKQGIIHSSRNSEGLNLYSSEEIEQIKSRPGPTVSETAVQVGHLIQREVYYTVKTIRKILLLIGGTLSGYGLLVVVFGGLFMVAPLQTAQSLGLLGSNISTYPTPEEIQQSGEGQILGATTIRVPQKLSPIQTMLQPISSASLSLIKTISPESYTQISKVAMLDATEFLKLTPDGAITSERPINIPESSLLQMGSRRVVVNLNSQYLQDRQPGINPGDIAIVGETGNSTSRAESEVLGSSALSGHAVIKAGSNEVEVIFQEEYTKSPTVVASVNLTNEEKINEIPSHAVYNLSPKGFKIKLVKVAPFDLDFSWISV